MPGNSSNERSRCPAATNMRGRVSCPYRQRSTVIRLCLVAVAALAMSACTPEPAHQNSDMSGVAEQAEIAPVVVTLDSIALIEDDSAFIALPSAIAIAPDGDIAVADIQNRRVYLYNRSGERQRIIGRPGKGPGELSAPSGLAFIDDTLMVVDDAGAQKLLLYAYPSGVYLRSMKRVGTALTTVGSGHSVWLGILRNSSGSTVTEWDVDTDSLRYHGSIPESYRSSERLRQVYGHVAATVSDNTLYYALVADSAVSVTDRRTGEVTMHVIPTRTRRGTPADLAARLEQTTRSEDYAGMASSLVALNAPGHDVLQAVHFDITYDRNAITAAGFLSALDLRTGQGCIDTRLSFSADARPQVTFVGDTLVTIDQAVVNDRSTTYVRFLAQPTSCEIGLPRDT